MLKLTVRSQCCLWQSLFHCCRFAPLQKCCERPYFFIFVLQPILGMSLVVHINLHAFLRVIVSFFFITKNFRYSRKRITCLFQMALLIPNISFSQHQAEQCFLLPFLDVLVLTDFKYLFGLKHFRKYISHSFSIHWSLPFTMLPKVVTIEYWP